jgi:hypothetical protein
VEQRWIDESMDWFVEQFGVERLRGEVVLPTDDYFPGAYVGSREDVLRVVDRLCAHMGVDRARIVVEHGEADDDHEAMSVDVPLRTSSQGAAGHYHVRDGRSVIGIRDDQARRPMALVATIAHELCHVLLLGGELITSDRADHEPLTDLLTVYFGLGIFTANAAFEFGQETRGRYSYTSATRLGYLTEPMFGYGLARFAWLRGESRPSWSRYLDTNPGTFLKHGLRFLTDITR